MGGEHDPPMHTQVVLHSCSAGNLLMLGRGNGVFYALLVRKVVSSEVVGF